MVPLLWAKWIRGLVVNSRLNYVTTSNMDEIIIFFSVL